MLDCVRRHDAASTPRRADAVERFEKMGASHFVVETEAFQLECEVLAGSGRSRTAARRPLVRWVIHFSTRSSRTPTVGHTSSSVSTTKRAGLPALASRSLCWPPRAATAMALILRGQVGAAIGNNGHGGRRRAQEILTELGVVSLPRHAGT